MKRLFFSIYLLALLGLIVASHSVTKVQAQSYNQIFISEVMADPEGADTGKEWIELYNLYDQPLLLSGWKLTSTSDSGTVRITNLPDLEIPAQSYFLVVENVQVFAEANVIALGDGKLNFFNTNATINLQDPTDASISQFKYFTGTSGRSFESPGFLNLEDCNKAKSHPDSNTINQQNSNYSRVCWGVEEIPPEEPAQELSTDLVITEVYPSPEAPDTEWIEVYNFGEFEIDLEGWYFSEQDSNGNLGSKNMLLPNQKILPEQHIPLPIAQITLNNSGDRIGLFSPDHNLIDEVIYQSTANLTSVGRIWHNGYPEDIAELSYTSPGNYNYLYDATRISNICDIKGQEINTPTLTSGTANVDLGIVSDRVFYLQNETCGIRVKVITDDVNVTKGQNIILSGTIKESNSEKYIAAQNIYFEDLEGNKLGSTKIANIKISNTQQLTQYVGAIVEITSHIQKKYSGSFDIALDQSSVRVGKSTNSDINFSDLGSGDQVKVTGILVFQSETQKLLLRTQEDLELISPQISAAKSQGIKKSAPIQTKSPNIEEKKITTVDYQMPNLNYYQVEDTQIAKDPIQIYVWPLQLLTVTLLGLILGTRLNFWIISMHYYSALKSKLENYEHNLVYFKTREVSKTAHNLLD